MFRVDSGEIVCLDVKDNGSALQLAAAAQAERPFGPGGGVVITSLHHDLLREELRSVVENFPDLEHIHPLTEYLFLREGWSGMVAKEGTEAIRRELGKIFGTKEWTFFHIFRADLIFGGLRESTAELLVDAVSEMARYHGKTLIFTYSSRTAAGRRFRAAAAKRCDTLYRQTSRDTAQEDEPANLPAKVETERSPVLLISDDAQMESLHDLLFENEKSIAYSRCSFEELKKGYRSYLNEESLLVIYRSEEQPLCNRMVETIRSLAPNAKLVWISGRDSLRQSDRHAAIGIGIERIFPRLFDLQEYILFLEQILNSEFYTRRKKRLPGLEKVVTGDRDLLQSRMERLRRERILFCNIEMESEGLDECNLSRMIREGDAVFVDRQRRRLSFVLIDILGSSAAKVLSKRARDCMPDDKSEPQSGKSRGHRERRVWQKG